MTVTLLTIFAATGALWADKHWRPQDIEVRLTGGNAGRVTFSHERHFGALAGKNCAVCHAEALGLGQTVARKSFALRLTDEPHGEKSLGRFCENCHRDSLPPAKTPAFSAFGQKGANTCAHCHAPDDHGEDFTRRHGDRAEHGAGKCAKCHRGATSISAAELDQARRYRDAQETLRENPDDKTAFAAVLPNNFCAYCHATDRKAWRREHDD
jgi:hypothetical protein